ncbi:MAG: hypothetical protein O8C58_00175 [Candidatus Methanoperedens sp.]|nr:hypothetical protein [Candidatus Methanoperedens sp.]
MEVNKIVNKKGINHTVMNIDGERDLAFNEDVMLGRLVNEMIRHMGASYVWSDTLPLIKKADLRSSSGQILTRSMFSK